MTVDRCVGKEREKLAAFKTFCAKVIAGIGTLPDTVSDRSIRIVMPRRRKDEPVAKFSYRDAVPVLNALRERLAAWANTAIDRLSASRPTPPDGLPDRAEEVWEPLFAIAELAGGTWPARARDAAVTLSGGEPDTESVGVQLLRAVAEIFAHQSVELLTTLELLRALVDREGEPWPAWWGRDVDGTKDGETPRKPARELAQRLKPFGACPKRIRVGDWTGRGYEFTDFSDAFSRFLGFATPQRHNAENQNEINGLACGVMKTGTDEISLTPHEKAVEKQGVESLCGVVALGGASEAGGEPPYEREPGEEG
jgi:hypothetical protein